MPLTYELLNDIGIRRWSDIMAKYDHPDLLLGNGFSIRQHVNFNYTSLFQNFLSHCPPTSRPSFEIFNTTNFELILEYLSYASKLNATLGLPTAAVDNLIDRLRNGLIHSIQLVHPNVAAINWPNLDRITSDLDGFNDVYTTNYDLYLYHIIMKAKDRYDRSEMVTLNRFGIPKILKIIRTWLML